MPLKLTDVEAYDLLHQASETLGRAEGSTVRANTALDAARMMLRLLQMGLLKAAEDDADHVEGLIDPERSPLPPPG